MDEAPRVSIVVLTYNRPADLRRTLTHLTVLPERLPIIVVDNASPGPSTARVLQEFPQVQPVRCEENRGAAGRNAGVDRVRTPYVAFCDDDTWWSPGALARAAALLDSCPRLGALAARILVDRDEREDPACLRMARSPLDANGLPGPALIAFMAGAVVMRTEAFRAAGGYEPRLFLGAEEALLALDMAAKGWRMAYVPDVTTHHHPSSTRDSSHRLATVARNRIWIAWMRLPWADAWREARTHLRTASRHGLLWRVLPGVLAGLPWAWRHRRVVPAEVQAMHRAVFGPVSRAR